MALMDDNEKELMAKGMLLGMTLVRYVEGGEIKHAFMKRVSDSRHAGMGLYSYYHTDTLAPLPEFQLRSQIDGDPIRGAT